MCHRDTCQACLPHRYGVEEEVVALDRVECEVGGGELLPPLHLLLGRAAVLGGVVRLGDRVGVRVSGVVRLGDRARVRASGVVDACIGQGNLPPRRCLGGGWYSYSSKQVKSSRIIGPYVFQFCR